MWIAIGLSTIALIWAVWKIIKLQKCVLSLMCTIKLMSKVINLIAKEHSILENIQN